jgi:hypothetical protein
MKKINYKIWAENAGRTLAFLVSAMLMFLLMYYSVTVAVIKIAQGLIGSGLMWFLVGFFCVYSIFHLLQASIQLNKSIFVESVEE